VVEFDHFRKEAGLPTFTLSVSNWIEKTGAIGLVSKAGRYGGTYAHKDIAFEFCGAISPVFKLYLIKEYQRLKEQESSPLLEESQIKFAYTSEADMLNLALFHYTAKQWRDANPVLAAKGLNPRDVASISELVVMVNLESMNATLIKQGLGRRKRYEILSEIAQSQLQSLNNADIENRFRAIDSGDPKLLK
jgi:hypothetical protein